MFVSSIFFARRIHRYFQMQPGVSLFDYGCGPGYLADHFSKAGITVTGADISEEYIAECRRKHLNSNFVLIGADPRQNESMLDQALSHAVFDYVIVLSIIQYFRRPEDVEAVIALLKKRLKPNGKLLVADVIVETTSSMRDVSALFIHCVRIGRIIAFVKFILYLVSSPYFKLSKKSPLLILPESFFYAVAGKNGLVVETIDKLSIHPTRKSFLFKREANKP